MPVSRAFLLLTVLPILPASPAAAGPPKERPGIGLVLSGGGARGAAHVGVLKVLDELRVPVDVIAGTSMGSIVGALYATGMSPREMEDALAAMDWDDIFVDKVPRADRPFRRKLDDAQYLTALVVGIRDGKLAFPAGLVEGQKLNFILRKLLLPGAVVGDFDSLPIRYRTVATDATNGDKVVLARGDLADSVRASMAFPGLFAPVEIGDRLLVDGGVAENLPVETAREAGASAIVAVNIGTPLASKERLGNLLAIVNQVTNISTARNVKASKAAIGPGDVLIEPQLGDISIIAFGRVREAVNLGEKAARASADRLRAFSVPDDEYRAWLARVRRKPVPPPTITSIELVNPSPVSTESLRRRLKTRPGPLDLDTLESDLALLHSTGEFDLVDFRIVPHETGNVLQVVIRDRAWGRTSARFGLDLSTDFRGDSAFELAATVTRTSINSLRGEWKLAGGVGKLTILGGELYQPITASGLLFVAPRGGWTSERVEIPAIEGVFFDYGREEVLGGLDIGITDGQFGELRLGVQRGYLWAEPRQGSALPVVRLDRGSFVARLNVDSRDNVQFPGSGILIRGEMSWESQSLGAAVSSRRLFALGTGAFSSGKNIVQLSASGGSSAGTDLPFYDQFFLGGFRRLSGYRTNELRGPYMAFGSLAYLREVGRLPKILGGGLYVGATIEAGNVWKRGADVSLSDLRAAGSAFLGGHTPLGPVYLAAGFGEGGRSVLYFVVGMPF